jgi:hypothetical protein
MALISDYDNTQSDPIYVVDFKAVKAPHLIFKSATDDSAIGAGTFHTVSIPSAGETWPPISVKISWRHIEIEIEASMSYLLLLFV